MLWKMSGPPVRIRVKTTARFVPGGNLSRDELIAVFERFQSEQLSLVRACDGLPLQRVQITSPFDAKFRYNLYSCLTILPRHQHRHLWQAERVIRGQ